MVNGQLQLPPSNAVVPMMPISRCTCGVLILQNFLHEIAKESRPSQDAKAGGQASTAESADPVGSSLAAKTPDSELRNDPAITPARSRVQDFCRFISSGIAFASSFHTLSIWNTHVNN